MQTLCKPTIMERVKIVLFKGKKLKDNSHPIVIRITKNNQRRHLTTDLRCKADHWDSNEALPNDSYRSKIMSKNRMVGKLTKIKDRIVKIEDSLPDDWTVEDFVNEYKTKRQEPRRVIEYFDETIRRLKKSRKIGNAETYRNAKQSLKEFIKKDKDIKKSDISFNELTTSVLQKFKEYHEAKGNKPGTISIHLRTIRAVYNRAIIDGYAKKKKYPFKKGLIPNGNPLKRAMTQDEFIKFKNENLEDPELIRARDYFVFSFYTRGMNFIDIAMLKLKNIRNGVITYERHKTKKVFHIRVHPQIKPIIQKYAKGKTDEEYLFPVVNPKFTGEVSIYDRIKKVRNKVNNDLRKIAKLAGIDQRITFYVARHSFATIMKYKGVSTESIQEFLGHTNVKTTETYLKSFGDPLMDELIEQTIDF